MKIVRVNPLIRNLPPEIVTLSNHLPPFHAPSCHPHTETMRVMIAPGTGTWRGIFGDGGPAKFCRPNDQC